MVIFIITRATKSQYWQRECSRQFHTCEPCRWETQKKSTLPTYKYKYKYKYK